MGEKIEEWKEGRTWNMEMLPMATQEMGDRMLTGVKRFYRKLNYRVTLSRKYSAHGKQRWIYLTWRLIDQEIH